MEDPSVIDLLLVCGSSIVARSRVKIWDVQESDVVACVGLVRPRFTSHSLPLDSPRVPVLSLIEELLRRSFIGVSRAVDHRPGVVLFDTRKASSRRLYLQCVLSLDAIWAKGVVNFSSNKSAAFFEYMLKSRGPIDMNMKAKAYKRKLALEGGNAANILALGWDEREVASRALVVAPAADDDDVAGDFEPDALPMPLALPAPAVASDSNDLEDLPSAAAAADVHGHDDDSDIAGELTTL